MESHTRFDFAPKCLIRIAVWWIAIAAALQTLDAQLFADGKLRRVSQTVRKHQPKPKPKPKPKPSKQDGGHSDSHDDRDTHHHDRHDHVRQSSNELEFSHRVDTRRRAPRRAAFWFHGHGSRFCESAWSQPRCATPVVVPVVTNQWVVPPPVIIEEPCPVVAPSPVFESRVIEEPQPVVSDPVFAPMDAPMVQEIRSSDPSTGYDWFGEETSRFWALVGSDFDGVTIGGLGLALQSPGSLGLDASVMTLRESTEFYRDHFWIGDVNVMYEVVPRGNVRGRFGLGVNWLSDAWGGVAGFNLTAGADLRLTERLLLSAEGDLGNLGDADYFHGRINLGRRFENSELMLGVDHFNIGGAEITNFFTGLQFRF